MAEKKSLREQADKLKQPLRSRSSDNVAGANVYKSIAGGTPDNPADAAYVTSGSLREDGYSWMRAAAYAMGMIDKDQCKQEHEISLKLKSVYGPWYNFNNHRTSILVPGSIGFLSDRQASGEEIPGARIVKKEIGQRLSEINKQITDESVIDRYKSINTLLGSQGGAMVPYPELGDVIDLSRSAEVFSSAGARNQTLPPGGRITFPKITSGSTSYWVGETATITDTQPTTGSLTLSAKKLATRVPVTNEHLRFSDPNAEAWLRMDMAAQMARAADTSMLEGVGGVNIKGLITYETASSWSQGTNKLLSYTSTGTPADGNSGYPFQPEDVYRMEGALPDEVSPTAWVGRKNFFSIFLNRRADAITAGDGKGVFVFDQFRETAMGPSPTLNGTKIVRSSLVSNTRTRGSGSAFTYVLLGNFNSWVIARAGVLELMVDPYTQMSSYTTVLQCVQLIDAGAVNPEHFVFCDQLAFS